MEKACSKCGEIKPITEFSRYKRRADGHRANCKKCQAEQDRQYRQRKQLPRNNIDNAEWRREKEILFAQLNGIQRQQAAERDEWERERTALKQARSDFEGRIRHLQQQIKRLEADRDSWQSKARDAESKKWSFSFGEKNTALKVFASIVGLPETAEPLEIKRAFRKAKAAAHPDNVKDRDWVSARYNASYDLFTQIYK